MSASPENLLDVKIWGPIIPDLQSQDLWGRGPASCVLTSPQVMLMRAKVGEARV